MKFKKGDRVKHISYGDMIFIYVKPLSDSYSEVRSYNTDDIKLFHFSDCYLNRVDVSIRKPYYPEWF